MRLFKRTRFGESENIVERRVGELRRDEPEHYFRFVQFLSVYYLLFNLFLFFGGVGSRDASEHHSGSVSERAKAERLKHRDRLLHVHMLTPGVGRKREIDRRVEPN